MKKPTTLNDIAAATGYSRIAVSMALRDQPGIAAKTREKIKKVATKLGYAPNLGARLFRHANYSGIVLLLWETNISLAMGTWIEVLQADGYLPLVCINKPNRHIENIITSTNPEAIICFDTWIEAPEKLVIGAAMTTPSQFIQTLRLKHGVVKSEPVD